MYPVTSLSELKAKRDNLRNMLAKAKLAASQDEVQRLEAEIEAVTDQIQFRNPLASINKMLKQGWRLIVTKNEAYLIKDGVVGKVAVDYTEANSVANYQYVTKVMTWKIIWG